MKFRTFISSIQKGVKANESSVFDSIATLKMEMDKFYLAPAPENFISWIDIIQKFRIALSAEELLFFSRNATTFIEKLVLHQMSVNYFASSIRDFEPPNFATPYKMLSEFEYLLKERTGTEKLCLEKLEKLEGKLEEDFGAWPYEKELEKIVIE